MRKTLCVTLCAVLLAGIAVTAQAKTYNLGEVAIMTWRDSTGQTVEAYDENGFPTSCKDDSPVLTGSSDTSSVSVGVRDGETTRLTLDNAALKGTTPVPLLELNPEVGRIDLILKGKNTLVGKDGQGADGLYISGIGADQSVVSIQGTGSLTSVAGADTADPAIIVDNAALSVDGGDVTGRSAGGYGIGLYGDATLSVSGDCLHPASVTAQGGMGSFEIDPTAELIIGDNNFVLDENGKDITAEVLANPELLKTIKYVIIATKDIAVFPGGDMDNPVHMMTAYKDTKFEQCGEPSAEAMSTLSAGQNGDALFAGSFAFTDDLDTHGKFQVNIVLPELAGRHVKLVTIENGQQVVYDRWATNSGKIWAHVDHLGDFAVFAA